MRVNLRGDIHLKVGSNVADVGYFNADNGLNVNDWNADNGNDNLWVVRLVVSSITTAGFAWWSGSIHQASCLFLAVLLEALNIFYLLWQDYLWKALRVFLIGLILC